jgi:hypothetical protein
LEEESITINQASDKLAASVKLFKRTAKQRCRYGLKWEQQFCNFDHTYLYKKVNQNVSPVQSIPSGFLCEIFGKSFAVRLEKHLVEDHEICVEKNTQDKVTLKDTGSGHTEMKNERKL